MLGVLTRAGCSATPDERKADLIIINTCGFLRTAVEEAIETILTLARNKELGCCRSLVVTGCLVQRYGKKLAALLPEVDAFVGIDGIETIDTIVRDLEENEAPRICLNSRPQFIMDELTPRKRATPFYSAYLKIAEGCSHRCAFCLIPRLRGRQRSRSIESVAAEAERLAEEGVREAVLIAQDTASYGMDLYGRSRLADLLKRLLEVRGIEWIRLLYLYPEHIDGELLEVMSEPGICKYFDIPLQHASDRILALMKRRYGFKNILDLVGRVRGSIPDAAIRTSLIVGFPGETGGDFEKLLRLVQEVRFDHLGVFVYQNEEGARSSRLSGQISERTKKARYRKLLECQQAISLETNRSRTGKVFPVLIEGLSDESEFLLKGRTELQAPDIDGQVYITDGQAEIGQIIPVRITEAHPYDLVGEIVDQNADLQDQEKLSDH